MKAQVAGVVLLVLAVIGALSSWSAMWQAPEGPVYLTVNALLAGSGVALVVVGSRRKRRGREESLSG